MNLVYAVQKVLRNHATHAFHFMHLCMIILSLTKMNKQFFQVVRDMKHNIETILEKTNPDILISNKISRLYVV